MSFSSVPLTPTLPIVAESIDALVQVRSVQQLFIASHALQLVAAEEETNRPSLSRWSLHGLPLTSRDALDQVRQAPETLSFMKQMPAPNQETTRFFLDFRRFIPSTRKQATSEKKAPSFDDLEFVVSTSEALEIGCKLLGLSSHIITERTPCLGSPVQTIEAHQLKSSTHRSSEGAMFLVVATERSARKTADQRIVHLFLQRQVCTSAKPGF